MPIYDTDNLVSYLQQELNYGTTEIDQISMKALDLISEGKHDFYKEMLEREVVRMDGSLELFFAWLNQERDNERLLNDEDDDNDDDEDEKLREF